MAADGTGSTSLSWSPLTPPAEEWRSEWVSAFPELEGWARRRKTPPPVPIMRASQLDAARLDKELTLMLQEQFLRAFSLFQPGYITALTPELGLLLDFLIFRFSVWSGKPTPGSTLMNLRYRDERAASNRQIYPPSSSGTLPAVGGRTGVEGPGLSTWQRLAFGLGTFASRYAWTRLDRAAAAEHWGDMPNASIGRIAWLSMRWAETAFRLASLANFLAFLRTGKYRNLLERAIKARLVYRRASLVRALSFEYLNRQLVWHELSELLLFLLPLVNVTRLRRFVLQYLPQTGTSAGAVQISSGACQQCADPEPAMPCIALPCAHKFCYYCLRTHMEHTQTCPACMQPITAARRQRQEEGRAVD